MANIENTMFYVFSIIERLRDENMNKAMLDGKELIFKIDQMIVIHVIHINMPGL